MKIPKNSLFIDCNTRPVRSQSLKNSVNKPVQGYFVTNMFQGFIRFLCY